MRTNRRVIILTLAITMLVAVLAVPAQAGHAGTMLSKINSARASAGLAPLETYWDLTDNARAQTDRMIAEGRIFHSSNLGGVTSVWEGLGENVGVHGTVADLHASFMASSGHRNNILGNFNYVGIGAKEDENGLVYATVIFMRAAPGLNDPKEETTTTTVAPTTTITVPPETTTTTAAPKPTVTTTTAPPATTTTTTPAKAASVEKASAPSKSSSTNDSEESEAVPAGVLSIEPLGRPDSATVAD